MAKKHLDELVAYQGKFLDGLCERGADRTKAEAFWNELLEFSKYAFNKSHSCAYSHVAYYTAYLKYYYPKEYYAAVMNTTDFDKIGSIIAECKENGIPVKQADVNTSEERFSIFEDSIVYGMSSIKEIGASSAVIIAERKKNGPFKSLLDFLLRTRADKTTTENLIYAGAFDELCNNRAALLSILPQYNAILAKIKIKEKDFGTSKEEKAKAKIEEFLEDMDTLTINTYETEDHKKKLGKEKEVTDCYLSSHPLDYYDYANEKAIEIADLKQSKFSIVIGVISNVKITNRKSDGKKMAIFELEDKTGTLDVCCFTRSYEEYGDEIKVGNVVRIEGSVNEEKRGEDEDEEIKLQLNVKTIGSVKEKVESICVQVEDIEEWVEKTYDIALRYSSKKGYKLMVFDKSQSEFRDSDLFVTKDILCDENIKGFGS